jgi:hypothetical protein
MRINFLLIRANTQVDYQTYFKTTFIIFVIHMISNMRLYILFGIGSPTCLKSNFYARTIPQGSSSHMSKDYFL